MRYASKILLGFFILFGVYVFIGNLWFPASQYRQPTNSIKALTLDKAKELAQSDWLELNGLTSISDEVAGALSQQRGYLVLNGLTSLSDKAAEALGKHRGSLVLNGLTSLSDKAAKSLAQHRDDLSLAGMTELSEKAVQSFRSAESNASGTKPSFYFGMKFRQ